MKKSKIITIIILIVLICSFTIVASLYYKRDNKKVYSNNNYTLAYDSSWDIKTKKDNYILLVHGKDSYLSFEITELKSDSLYNSPEDLKEEILYTISKNNKDYNLIVQEEATFTNNKYDGYKVLYETDSKQVMVGFYKAGNKLVSIIYEANNDVFDILLDSVLNIIYNFDVKNENFNTNSKLSVQTKEIVYSDNSSLDELLRDSNDYEIANNNYLVNYSLPAIFKLNSLNSIYNLFSYKEGKASINITTNIYMKNIYEYVNKDLSGNIYSNYSYYKTGDDYSNFTEQMDELNSKYDSYIYKNSYTYTMPNSDNQTNIETVELIYALNNNHLFVVKLEARGCSITKKLIDSIKINSSKNYASYVTVNKSDGNLIAELQKIVYNESDGILKINIRVPDKYKEVDNNCNIYLERYYELGYNDNIENSDYKVHYELTNLKPEQIVDIYNKTYIGGGKDNKPLNYVKDVIYNGKTFKLYEGGYSAISGVMFTNTNRNTYYINKKMLFYVIDDSNVLYIEISGNNKDINDDIINELSVFDIK